MWYPCEHVWVCHFFNAMASALVLVQPWLEMAENRVCEKCHAITTAWLDLGNSRELLAL